MDASRFPWPATEGGRTPNGALTPIEWWDGLDPQRRKRWAPILSRLSVKQREEFHEDRRAMATTLPLDAPISFREVACDQAERRLHEKWKGIALRKEPVKEKERETVSV
jgi:hypothetical protein